MIKKFLIFVTCALALASQPARAQMSDDAVIAYVKQGMASGKSQNDMARELAMRGVTREQAERLKTRLENEQANSNTAAREAGARGGTVISARGTANAEARALFDIEVSGEKEIVVILVKNELKDGILKAINQEVGLNKPGQGIVFSMPVDSVVGLGE